MPVSVYVDGITDSFNINIELKNVSSPIWHQGFKQDQRRVASDANSPLRVPDIQLYIDVCLRICEILRNSEMVAENDRQPAVALAISDKSLLIKKASLLTSIHETGEYDLLQQIAQTKLTINAYELFKQVHDATTMDHIDDLIVKLWG